LLDRKKCEVAGTQLVVTVDTPGPRDMLTDLITMFHAANATIDVYYSSALHIEKQIQADKYIHDKPSRFLERDLQPVLEKTLCKCTQY